MGRLYPIFYLFSLSFSVNFSLNSFYFWLLNKIKNDLIKTIVIFWEEYLFLVWLVLFLWQQRVTFDKYCKACLSNTLMPQVVFPPNPNICFLHEYGIIKN